jgi:hypothetical protein
VFKEYDETSVYYSIRYDIWLSDVVARYNEINRALKGVQTSTIEKHEFIDGIRIPDNDELIGDADAALAAAIAKEKADAAIDKEALRAKLQGIRNDILKYNTVLTTSEDYGYNVVLNNMESCFDEYKSLVAAKNSADEAVVAAQAAYDAAKAIADADGATDEQKQAATDAETALKEAQAAAEAAKIACEASLAKTKAAYVDYLNKLDELEFIFNARESYVQLLVDFALLEKNDAYTPAVIAELKAMLNNIGFNLYRFDIRANKLSADAKDFADDITANYPELLPEKVEDEDNSGVDNNTQSVDAYNKYATAESSIVYEEYSNGTAFVLNFNNFAVKVCINGVYYTVAAYGYIILN